MKSEVQTQRELDLPRIEHCARRSIKRIGRAFTERRRAAAILCGRVLVAEIRRPISGVKETDVDVIHQVKGLRQRFQAGALSDGEDARNSQVHGLEDIALEGVARLQSDAVIVAKDVAVGVKAGKLCE